MRVRHEVYCHSPEINPVHVLVRHLDFGPRRIPHTFCLNGCKPRLYLRDQIVAQDTAIARRILIPHLRGQGMGLRKIPLPLQYAGPFVQRLSSSVRAVPLRGKTLQSSHANRCLIRANRHVIGKLQAMKIRVCQGGRLDISLMKGQQILIQANGSELGGIQLRGNRYPGQKLRHRGKHRAIHHDLKIILGFVRPLLASTVVGQGLVHQKIVQRRTHRIWHIALFNQIIIFGNGGRLERRVICQGRSKMRINFSQNPSQVPRGYIITWRL